MADSPFAPLVGAELDTVSFVRDHVELRIGYSIVRFLTDPSGTSDGQSWQLTGTDGADSLRRYVGRTVVAVEFDEHVYFRLFFDDAEISASLRDEDRQGPEALHFMPADPTGRVHSSDMFIW